MLHLKNRVQLIGFLGMDPEVKHLSDGKILARVSLATNDSYKNQQGTKINETQWHNLVAWGKTAEIAEKYFKKGKEVAVEGKLATRSYEDKQGVRKYVTEVVVNNILLLGTHKQ